MNNLQAVTLDRIIGCTMSIVDQHKCLAALAYARKYDIEPECRQMILTAKLSWLTWHTLAQRKWQSENTRNPNKARHHDSIALREKYVRCNA